MSQLEKYTDSITPKIREYLISEGGRYADMEIGDYFIRENYVVKVVGMFIEPTPKGHSNEMYHRLIVVYQKFIDYECLNLSEPKNTSWNDFKQHFTSYRLPRDTTPNEWYNKSIAVINGDADLSEYESNSVIPDSETSLAHRVSKDSLIAIQNEMELTKIKAEVLRAFIGKEMEKRKGELELIRRNLSQQISVFNKKIERIMRVVVTIELYLGINEEIFQIQDGIRADKNCPITFRQRVLFMDEEMGDWKNGGRDWTDISFFDEWMIKNDNYKEFAPENKCVVVFRPRRKDKDYKTDNTYYSSSMNENNRLMTYIFIRNGECLYRIYTENIIITDRLFPKRNELLSIFSEMDKINNDENSWGRDKESQEDKIYDTIGKYKKRAILMQGLIDRTEVLHPLPIDNLSMFNLDEAGDKIQFIYDDEITLPSGRMSFKDWRKDVNSKIKEGSRILITGNFGWKKSDYDDRFFLKRNYNGGISNIPSLPQLGIYEVEMFSTSYIINVRESEYKSRISSYKEKGIECKGLGVSKGRIFTHDRSKVYVIQVFNDDEKMTIKYNPEDTVYTKYDSHERKNKIRFAIYDDDDFVLNYDQIDLDDINFYLTSRVDRPNYLEMMPLLESIKSMLISEKEKEDEFIKFVTGRNSKLADESELRKQITSAIDWWKFKNKWKRSISKNDTLALRMIEKRITTTIK